MKQIFLIVSFIFSFHAYSQATLLGHNLSPTTYTPEKGRVSIGTYAAFVAVTDDIVIGTSPWMYFDYNMYTLVVRQGKQIDEKSRLGWQMIYFKTDRDSSFISDGYQMEAFSGNLTYTRRLNNRFALHFNYNHMYFLDETVPFSLRREPFNDDTFQSTVTLLAEVQGTSDWGFLGEIGVLGLNYVYPQTILGLSTNYKSNNYLVQFGFNITSTPKALFISPRVDANNYNNGRLTNDRYDGKNDFSIHPEIQFQYTF
jgi:hypothetical protein